MVINYQMLPRTGPQRRIIPGASGQVVDHVHMEACRVFGCPVVMLQNILNNRGLCVTSAHAVPGMTVGGGNDITADIPDRTL